MNYPEIMEFESNESLSGLAALQPDITYSTVDGKALKLTLITPWRPEGEIKRHPLVVFVQGSAWTTPDINYEIPQLAQLARDGYVVATIVHRSSLDGCAFPAYLVDTKAAIRFLRAHAEEYGIDPEKVCIYGTSSGGNTALLVGVTGDFPAFKSGENAEYSDAVQCVVECFGPTELKDMIDPDNFDAHNGGDDILDGLAGGGDKRELLSRMSPTTYVQEGGKYPPFLIAHGDADPMVPYEQGTLMFHRLIDVGANARMIRVKGAPHEGPFWSPALVDEIFGFIKGTLKNA